MWKLNIDKSFETEYIDKMLHDLVTRVKTWKEEHRCTNLSGRNFCQIGIGIIQ